MRVALDTNVLVCAEGMNGPERREHIIGILDRIPGADTVLPVQVLGELFNILSGRAGWQRERSREAVRFWQVTYRLIDSSADVLDRALELAADHGISTWDAVVLAAASAARCRILLSEDMQDGFSWGGVTVTDPFAAQPHPLLAAVLAPRR